MILHYWSHQLPFQHPFAISSGTKTHQPTLIVALQLGNYIGFGEAPAISYYNVTVEQMIEEMTAKRKLVEKFSFTDPERYWHYLHHLFPGNPFLVCALDMAGWDLWGKMKRLPLFRIWDTPFEDLPLTDYTIGLGTVQQMIDKVKEKPWPIYKIKLGSKDDIKIIEAIRRKTNAVLRIDANGGWQLDEAVEKIHAFKDLDIELIEQPLHKGDWEGMKKLYDMSSIPLIADESCVTEHDVAKCVGYFHGINIKLTKCSGITPARRMIKDARSLGLKVMMGCMNESSIGTAAVVHFLPQVDYADIDGPLLLASDLASGVKYDHGQVTVGEVPGLGITSLRFDFQQN